MPRCLQVHSARTRSASSVNGRFFQPLGLVILINTKQWVQIDEIGGVNVAVADKTVNVEVFFSEPCDILVHSGDLGLRETGIEVYRRVAFCVESDVDSSQPAVVEHGFILSPIVLLPV